MRLILSIEHVYFTCFLVQCVRNTPAFFATKLYKSMKGLGTDDSTLIRVIVTRCEVDMLDIKQEFQNKYQKTLASFIKVCIVSCRCINTAVGKFYTQLLFYYFQGDTSGNYRKTLLGLIGEPEN